MKRKARTSPKHGAHTSKEPSLPRKRSKRTTASGGTSEEAADDEARDVHAGMTTLVASDESHEDERAEESNMGDDTEEDGDSVDGSRQDDSEDEDDDEGGDQSSDGMPDVSAPVGRLRRSTRIAQAKVLSELDSKPEVDSQKQQQRDDAQDSEDDDEEEEAEEKPHSRRATTATLYRSQSPEEGRAQDRKKCYPCASERRKCTRRIGFDSCYQCFITGGAAKCRFPIDPRSFLLAEAADYGTNHEYAG